VLTASILDRLGLHPGARVLDIGSGTGATLEELRSRGLAAIGIDYSPSLASQAADAAPVVVGDGEALPYADRSFDAVFAECVLSAIPDKHACLTQVRRVVTTGGWFVLTDMVVHGRLPDPLQSVAAWAACIGGARSAAEYEALLVEHGLTPVRRQEASAQLTALVAQAQRRFAMIQGALGVGLLRDADALFGPELARLGVAVSDDGLAQLAEVLFAQVRAAITRGELGYVAIVAVA
jgi:SAM-dependent methyltransferase